MQIGLIGTGNMGSALARGLGEPLLCHDVSSERAAALAAELGGAAVASNAELAERSDLVLLCHKPYQLDAVAEQIGCRAKAVLSVLAGVPIEALQAAYPGVPVFRTMPNTPVELGRGVVCYAPAEGIDRELEARVLELLGRLGTVLTMAEEQLEAATAVTGVGPAYVALIVEAMVDAAIRHGLPAPLASELVVATLGGSTALLDAKGRDTLAVRRGVTSPGGVTARGLDALERGGLRTAFSDAMDAATGRSR